MRKKALLGAAVIAALMLPLAACSSAGQGAGDGKTTISFLAYQGEAAMKPVVAEFEKENPNITVNMTNVAGGGGPYSEQLQTRFAGNQAPDVFQLVSENRTEILNNKLAVDLSGQKFIKNVDPSLLSLYKQDGKVYGVTSTAWMGTFIYNKDLLAKAGYSTFPTTWADFITMGEKLKQQGTTPYLEDETIASGSLTSLLASMYGSDGTSVNSVRIDGKPKGSTFAKDWTPAITEWQKAVKAGVLSKDTVGLGGDQIKSAFLSGQVAVFRSGNWDLADLQKSGVHFGVAPFPAYPGGKPFINGGGDPAYAVSVKSSSQKQAAGLKFLSFLTSKNGVKLLCEGTGAQSVANTYTSDPGADFRDVYKNYLKTGQYYWVDWSKNATGMSQVWNTQQQQLIQGQATPKSFAEALDSEFNKGQ